MLETPYQIARRAIGNGAYLAKTDHPKPSQVRYFYKFAHLHAREIPQGAGKRLEKKFTPTIWKWGSVD